MTSPGGSAKPLSQKALRLLVSDLAGKIERLEQELSGLRTHNQTLQEEVERLQFQSLGVEELRGELGGKRQTGIEREGIVNLTEKRPGSGYP
ncbi:hypothetical protein ACETIH_10565 [Microvirga arabica]|uniref:Uncharacterized protein n=1 Tax=Microvirga arabica TaxID=1128671 RepID=A0ABV6Y799_9HYPH